MHVPLTSEEGTWLERIKSTLRERQLVHMNEATLWGARYLSAVDTRRTETCSGMDRSATPSDLPDI